MTCLYSDINQHDALYKIARSYPGGVEALASRMGMSRAVLYNKLRPGVKTHHITFEEVSLIIEYCEEAGVDCADLPLRAFNWRHGKVAIDLPSVSELSDEDLSASVYRVMKEIGDVAGEISKSMEGDNKIDSKELARIEKEFEEALGAVAEWRARVARRAERDSLRG